MLRASAAPKLSQIDTGSNRLLAVENDLTVARRRVLNWRAAVGLTSGRDHWLVVREDAANEGGGFVAGAAADEVGAV